MTREEKCLLAIEKGYKYNPETGDVIGPKGKKIKSKHKKGYFLIGIKNNNKHYSLFVHQFAWYVIHKKCVECLDHINGVRTDSGIMIEEFYQKH